MNTIFGNQANPETNSKSFEVVLNKNYNVTFTYKDPYGLISATSEGFDLPEELKGNFTSAQEARKAVNDYLIKNPLGPVIKSKKVA